MDLSDSQPLISCIMPTRGRPQLARKAVDYFSAQTWPNKELLILDDDDCPSFQWIPDGCRVYQSMVDRLTIGAKRNLLCAIAKGDIIAHWDSDDYSAPTRLAKQYELLESSGKAITAFHSMMFVDERKRDAAIYRGDPEDILGTSLMYRRNWWMEHLFEDIDIQEDIRFARHAYHCEQMHSTDAGLLMIARAHSDNTSPKILVGENWKSVDYDLVSIP